MSASRGLMRTRVYAALMSTREPHTRPRGVAAHAVRNAWHTSAMSGCVTAPHLAAIASFRSGWFGGDADSRMRVVGDRAPHGVAVLISQETF